MTQVLSQTDSYKLSHKGFMDEATSLIYANLTARSDKHLPVLRDRYDGKVLFWSLQAFIIDYLINEWNRDFFNQPKEKVIGKFKRLVDGYLGAGAVDMAHFEALHDLGYLPIEIKALPEGSLVNIKVPFLTIKNTHPDFAWLTNYLETVMSCALWKPITTATIAREYRKLINEYALRTTGSLDFTQFQAHDFSFRGMSNRQDAAACGAGFLISSNGTDTIPAIDFLEDFYNADVTKEFIGTSVPASEHSIMCLGIASEGEDESVERFITEAYPSGIVSVVGDTVNYWKFLKLLCKLKDKILARPVNELGLSKVVARPDSGNPADIICGLNKYPLNFVSYEQLDEFVGEQGLIGSNLQSYSVVKVGHTYYDIPDLVAYKGTNSKEYSEAEVKGSVELLWETFGGTITEQGYKVLDSHIGLIYGDSITLAVALDVFERLEAKGFASTNIVFGVGSYTMQYLTRDSLGMAVKATYAEVGGKGYELFKDPITDNGMKKSAKGLLRVEKEENPDGSYDFVLYDQQTLEQEQQGELKTVFKDGKLIVETSLSEIRQRVWGN